MSMITFPTNPTTGQQYVADNAVTYTWLGNRWSAATAIANGTAEYYVDGGYAPDTFDPAVDLTLDGNI